ncbi:MAG: FlgD immunoglobulin-like domain containing protein [Candidatus Neomarinimicrobiota bacterium]|nr:FlgD immunoglobulin-like domain containing protein [Candidatus Neomarinimicrobiota bacterium]
MRKIYGIILTSGLIVSGAWADLDCPADSAIHVDTRTMLPDGSPNPTYGQEISTGLCGCLGYVDGAVVDGNEVTFTIRMVDNEPIRGIELDIYHDSADLVYGGLDKGDKLENVTDEEGNPRTMTLLGNYLEDHLKVLAYSTSRARTAGDGTEGDLIHVTYELADGASLPDQVTFYFGLANLPGTSMDPELLNVVCGYPDADNPVAVSTSSMGIDGNETIPDEFALNQNYPNPFNPSTQISFDVPQGGEHIMLNIYNILGQNVSTLVNGVMNPGTYTMEWNATDEAGNPVASGIYFYELRSSSFTARKKMLLIR